MSGRGPGNSDRRVGVRRGRSYEVKAYNLFDGREGCQIDIDNRGRGKPIRLIIHSDENANAALSYTEDILSRGYFDDLSEEAVRQEIRRLMEQPSWVNSVEEEELTESFK